MSVSDGEHILVEQLDRGVVVDDATVQLGVVGLRQGDDLHGTVLHLHLELGVLLRHDGQLDTDVTTFGSSK